MASKILPQALLLVQSNHGIQCPPMRKQLSFSSDSSRRFCLSSAGPTTYPIFSSTVFAVSARKSLLARSGAEGALAEAVEEEGEVEAAAEEGPEPEPEVQPRVPRVKLGDIMGILNKRAVEASEEVRAVPDIRTGDILQIKLEVPENRRRLSIYKGIVISRQNAGIHTTIRVRRIIAGVGVEIVFPLYSPNIKEIKVVANRKVRKARLYYLRDKLPRLSTFK